MSPCGERFRAEIASGTISCDRAVVQVRLAIDPSEATSRFQASPRTSIESVSGTVSVIDWRPIRVAAGSTRGRSSATVDSGATVGVGSSYSTVTSPAPNSGMASMARSCTIGGDGRPAAASDVSASAAETSSLRPACDRPSPASSGLSSSPFCRTSSVPVRITASGTASATNSSGTWATSKRIVSRTIVSDSSMSAWTATDASTRRGRKRRVASKLPSVPSRR